MLARYVQLVQVKKPPPPPKSQAANAYLLAYSSSDVQLDRILAQGRFAVIYRGSLLTNNGNTPIAVKLLKRMYSLHYYHVI